MASPTGATRIDIRRESVSDQFERLYVRPAKGRTLVIGAKVFPGRHDRRALFDDVAGLDMQPGEGVDIVHDLETPLEGKYAHVDCVSVLEHCRRPWVVAENIQNLMAGTIFVSVPFVWPFHGYPSDYFRFTAEGVKALFSRVRWDVLKYGHDNLYDVEQSLPRRKFDDYPHFPRTEVFGFGWI